MITPEEKQLLRDELKEFKRELNVMSGINESVTADVKRAGKLIDIVKTIDDVYACLGRTKPEVSNYDFLPLESRERALNEQYIIDMILLFNEGWIADFTNSSQRKYYVWFERKASGWVVLDVSFLAVACSGCGSGWYYKDEATAKYCSKQFLSIYNKALN